MEAMLTGFASIAQVDLLLVMLAAVLLGSFFGIVPGLGGTVGLALTIPFLFGVEPIYGIVFLVSMHAVVHTGASIPAILFGVPGTSPTAATILDGHPMAEQGRAGVAMGAQLAASGIGGVGGALALAALIPVLTPVAMAMNAPTIFALIVFGMTFIVAVSRTSIPEGFIAALFGMLIAMVGLNPHTGIGRFTFGQLWLWDGISIVVVVLGVFGFAEMIALGARGVDSTIAEGDVEIEMRWSQLWEGTKAVFQNWWLTLRTSVMGAVIGIVPGLGGDAATWICYAHAAQTCKNNENFGNGDVRGVIAVETTNNAKEGGALLPTVVFGIPGSSGMAILMGAFLIMGITPGPEMLTEHLDMIWAIVGILVISNLLCMFALYPLSGFAAKLTFVRSTYVVPPILILMAVGAFIVRGVWQDVVLAVILGFVGYGMKKWGFPRGPLVLGFVLAPLAENYLIKSLGLYGVSFVTQPIPLILLFLAILSLGYGSWESRKGKIAQGDE